MKQNREEIEAAEPEATSSQSITSISKGNWLGHTYVNIALIRSIMTKLVAVTLTMSLAILLFPITKDLHEEVFLC